MTEYATFLDIKYQPLEDRVIDLGPRQAVTIPRGVQHRPRAPERTIVVMAEGAGVVPTGD